MVVMCLGAGNARVLSYNPISGKQVSGSATTVLNNYIAGFYSTAQTFSSATSSTMTISSGQATNLSNTIMYTNSSGFSWSVANGNAANGYAGGSSLPSSGTIHFFVIAQLTDTTWTASFAASSINPTLPSSYSSGYYRRIFSLPIGVSSAILTAGTFIETEGGGLLYWLSTQTLDLNGSSMVSSARTLAALGSVPTGIKVSPVGRAYSATAANTYILTSGDETDAIPVSGTGFTAAPGADAYNNGSWQNGGLNGSVLTTNTSAQIGIRGYISSSPLYWVTRGFKDFRRT
jgi:hypothetical protein